MRFCAAQPFYKINIMTKTQELLCKLHDFIYQEKDENNPHLEITLEEAFDKLIK